jgi:hypothetical protein
MHRCIRMEMQKRSIGVIKTKIKQMRLHYSTTFPSLHSYNLFWFIYPFLTRTEKTPEALQPPISFNIYN